MEHLRQGDILKIEKIRGYKNAGRVPISEMINISDAIQSIFEYI